MNLLLIDDNLAFAESLAAILTALGHTPYVAATALGGQVTAETHRPDAVLLDLVLPAGGSREFLAWLRGRPETRDVPVVISTGLPPERTEWLAAEPNLRVLEKPSDPAVLLEALGVPEARRESER